jgi:uncharacterized membrane protein YedE/YeeE
MLTSFVALMVGLVFGMGLIVSGMADPEKVLAFLDVTGSWDPSLALVMVGAIATAFVPFQIAARGKTALAGTPMQLPDRRDIDGALVGGSLLFGVGWGLAGICPGPAVVLLGYGSLKGIWFIAALLASMAAYAIVRRVRARDQ